MLNNDLPVLEGGLKLSGNDEDQTAEVEEPVGKFDDILHAHEFEKVNDVLFHPHKPGSPTKIEVSGNSINLYVEVFGPLDGKSGRDETSDYSMECKLGETNFKQELSLKANGTLSTCVTDQSTKYEGEDLIGEQECTFDIGDLVWIKARAQLWWPGMISDPSSAPNDMKKFEKKGSYLVKYYGSATFIWCENAELKPFARYFEQLSGQNNSRNFYGSVDRALCEIGRRVKLKMTCSCFSKDSRRPDAQFPVRNKEENFMSMKKASAFDVISLSQFQPAAFVANIKDRARSMRVPGKIELMVMKNRLVPFYRAIGHFELPLQLLRSSSDAAQNTQEHLISGVRDENHNDHRNSVEAHDGGFSRTRRQRKRKNHSDGSDIVLDDEITSSARGLGSRERKKSKYLSYPYVDVKKEQQALNLKRRLQGSAEADGQMEGGRVVKTPRKQKASVKKCRENNVVGDESSESGSQKAKEKARGRRAKKREAETRDVQLEGIRVVKESEGVNLASSMLVNRDKFPNTENLPAEENGVCWKTNKENESSLISFQQACDGVFKSSRTPQKSEGLAPRLSETKLIHKLPDFNGEPEQRKEGVVSPTINGVHEMDVQVTGPYRSTNVDRKARALDPITMSTGVSTSVQRPFQMADFLSDCKPKPKKGRRKGVTCQVATGLPDLNLMSPPGIPTPEGSCTPPEDEQRKKRRYRSASGNLLLNFAPGCAPPKETLLATFSRFGLLKESELEVASDDRVKIVYERISDARFALRSLEKSHTFGESLLGFNLDSCSTPYPPKMKKKNNLQLHSFVPCRNRSRPGETPDIAFIKQNVEMMKSTLQKAGDDLSPETRAKLEKEIKAFLDKISSLTGSSLQL